MSESGTKPNRRLENLKMEHGPVFPNRHPVRQDAEPSTGHEREPEPEHAVADDGRARR
jgi:hypothetical protein